MHSRYAGRFLFGCFSAAVLFVAGIAVYCSVQARHNDAWAASAGAHYAKSVIIDPGHGGPDGGAVGADGAVEKDINLAISLKLAGFFRASGFQVIMTRRTDRSIHDSGCDTIREMKSSDLHNRLKIGSEHPQSLFISIHQNNFTQPQYSGTQVFYSQKNPDSKFLAQTLQTNIHDLLQPNNDREIKPAEKNLFILYYAKSPTVMVECGFLSNPTECRILENNEYQDKMAFAIFSGTLQFYSAERQNAEAGGEDQTK